MDARKMAEDWTALWSGSVGLAESLPAPDFRIHSGGLREARAGDAARDRPGMVAYIRGVYASNPHARLTMDPAAVAGTDQFAIRWGSHRPAGDATGIDVAHLAGAMITEEVWPVGAARRV